MSLTELMPMLRALPRSEKVRAIQYLAAELGREEDVVALIRPGMTFEVWSPYDAHEAAATMMRALETGEKRS